VEPGDKTTNRIRGTTPEIEAAARGLRRALTPAERVLWQALRNRQVGGLKFRCQHPVGRFIVDFYCPACKLVVELDGGVHDDRAEIDEARTQMLNNYGYRVLRFRNEEVLRNLDLVLEQILQAASVPHS
jgi:very-short-patch-repair endonuclease